MSGRFLKQTPRLNAWANSVKSKAIRNLDGVIKNKPSTGALARSIRFFRRDKGDEASLEFSFNWYGLYILESSYPSGKSWGRRPGKLKRAKRAQPWITPAIKDSLDNLETIIAQDIADGLGNILEP
jgi:hypothetical protein